MPLLDLSSLSWTLTGWRPHAWRFGRAAETGGAMTADFGPFPAQLPGSVQGNLRRAGVIPDWNEGLRSLEVEWVEHRHWMFTAEVAALPGSEAVRFRAESLDYAGWILVDGVVAGTFRGSHIPAEVDLGGRLRAPGRHTLSIVFDLPPEGQGQLGMTSAAREMKPRYSFGWDWCVRLVPIGAAGALVLEDARGPRYELERVRSEVSEDFQVGRVWAAVRSPTLGAGAVVRAEICLGGRCVARAEQPISGEETLLELAVVSPELWWPNQEGNQVLYALRLAVHADDREVASWEHALGFKRIEWRPCEGAPPDALPWLCCVNGRPVFLQGVNWTPPRMAYQDTTESELRELVEIYRGLGCNLLRVWGGAYLESSAFYEACDCAGLLVWQEFPLSSSGVDSVPPSDEAFVAEMTAVARHAVRSRRHHACLLQWCGGNELHADVPAGAGTRRVPLDLGHPVLATLARVVAAEDPDHRFLPTSPFGPRFHSSPEEFGRGVHHEVHGPWGLDGHPTAGEWERYWREDDALFRGETGVAGASRLALIRRYGRSETLWPPTRPLWRHASSWWTQWGRLRGCGWADDPDTALAGYVEHTRREQAERLAFAARTKKEAFPRCGGFLVWMGHDAYPCLANTSIVEFDRALKPAALALAEVFKSPVKPSH